MKWRRRAVRGPVEWEWLRGYNPHAATVLDALANDRALADIDRARIFTALRLAHGDPETREVLCRELVTAGPAALVHPSGQRDLPGERLAAHNLATGTVRLGQVVPTANSVPFPHQVFGIGYNELRTSMMVIGPPGSGKTRSLAVPIVEHLSLGALTGNASMVVIDPKSTDFDFDGWFDITIDPLRPTHGFSLFGGAPDAAQAADRLADALLPTNMSDDKAYFRDASYNALYDCLGPFHTAYRRWPTIRELLSLLRANPNALGKVKGDLKGVADRRYWIEHLDNRHQQSQGSYDPAASLVERFARLDRPALREIFDHPNTFAMRDINRPIRVRFAIPDAQYPEASRTIARLVVSQFVQTTAAHDANTGIFKGLVIEEAGRYVDDYVARGVQKVRSNNAGLVLLTQSFADFPEEIRNTIFGSTGCKAVFGGVDPFTADHFSRWFGDEWITDTTITRGRATGVNYDITPIPHPTGYRKQQSQSVSSRRIERARWTPSDITTRVPTGHSVMALSTADGHRVGPVLVNHRG